MYRTVEYRKPTPRFLGTPAPPPAPAPPATMSLTTRAWTAWKSLSLPWRRRRLAGLSFLPFPPPPNSLLHTANTTTTTTRHRPRRQHILGAHRRARPPPSSNRRIQAHRSRLRRLQADAYVFPARPRVCRALTTSGTPAQWHQWLRYTRADAPSVRELQGDIARLAALRRNAAIADERWRGGGGGGVLPEGDPWREADAAGGYRPREWKGVRRREE